MLTSVHQIIFMDDAKGQQLFLDSVQSPPQESEAKNTEKFIRLSWLRGKS